MYKKNIKLFGILAILICLVTVFSGCGQEGYVIGVANGTTYADYAEQNFNEEKVKEIKVLDDDNLTLQELAADRCDAVITDKLVGLRAIKEGGFDDLEIAGNFIYKEIIGIAVRQEDDALRQAINKALEEVIKDGTYAEISNKYFGADILEGVDYEATFSDDPEATDDSLERIKEAGEVTFAMSGGYPPFNYYTEDDELTGFDVEIGMAIAEKMGVTYTPITTGDFGALIEGLRSKRYDAILGSMAINEKRLEVVDFTNPYYYSGAQLIVKKGSEITGPETFE
jgi:ABC-type amino acid transport substrate-binding protein